MSDGIREEPLPLKRRDFLKLVGVTSAAAAGAGCNLLTFPPPPENVLPYVTPNENIIPGVATYYASTCRECPAACGLHVKTREGRAIKLEGNPNHPVNQGTLCARGHAALHGLYNPDRLTKPKKRNADGSFADITWADAEKLLAEKLQSRTGELQFWTGQETGTRQALYDQFIDALGQSSRWVHEPFAWEAVREGNRLSLGRAEIPTYDFAAAGTVFTFGADFLETWISPTEYARTFAATHGGESSKGRMVAFEPRMSLTGQNADEWIAIRPGMEAVAALAMAQVIVAEGLAKGSAGGVNLTPYAPATVAERVGVPAETLVRLAREFASHGPGLAIAGGVSSQGVHASHAVVAANVLTSVAGGMGTTIHFGRAHDMGRTNSPRELTQPIAQMNAGLVGVLLVHGTNPAYSLPTVLEFENALKKVPFKVSFSLHLDETASLCDLVLPDHHPLESWGDAAAWSGVRGLIQPAMRPVFDTKSTPDVLMAVAKTMGKAGSGLLAAPSWHEALRTAWGGAGKAWDEALARGGDFGGAAATAAAGATLAGGAAALDFTPVDLGGDPNGMPIVVYASPNLYDGRGASKPWLQELPDPVTKITWDHWVEMHPDTMKRLGLKRGDHVALKTPGGTLETAAYDYIGIRPDVLAISTGQGHTSAGSRYWKRGANAFAPMTATYDEASGALAFTSVKGALSKTGKKYYLAYLGGDPHTGGQSRQMGRGIGQAIPLTALSSHAGATNGAPGATNGHGAASDTTGASAGKEGGEVTAHGTPGGHGEPATSEHGGGHGDPMMHKPGYVGSPVPADPIEHAAKERPNSAYALQAHHRWAMAIDLNSCNGCQACILACNLENNVAFVGKEQVERGREMSWLRLERYYEGGENGEKLSVFHVPMLCQQCGAAPCESVCPVYATYRNPEGLNAMIYNRCVGTRYCSNNCPYKVRAFNWFSYEFPAPLNWQLNPDVTVRDKGVMEKCTFCVQRIRDAKDKAKDEGRKVRDGDMVTACQQTCPTRAITFGDLKDPQSRIAQIVAHERGYKVFEEINTYPAITYLKKVTRETPA